MKNLIKSIVFLSICFISIPILGNDKVTVEEIISKHLDSIGTKDKRTALKNLVFTSSIRFKSNGSATVVSGNGVFASENDKNLWGMILKSNDYPQDKFSFNGEKVKVAFTKPGTYSILGDFIFSNKGTLRDGLLGGVLFSSWALNNQENRQAKISTSGTKKFDSMETYVLSYSPKSALDLDIRMYFDKKTFRHVRTEYSKVIAARQVSSIDNSAGQSAERLTVIEEFSNFQPLDGLMLPNTYSITHSYYNNSPIQASRRSNKEVSWEFKITNFSYNQQLDANSFEIETN